jgi:hypothetical protein
MRELQDAATGASRTGGVPYGNHRRSFLIASIAAVLMTAVGAFGTSQAPLPTRLAYWLIIMECGAMIGLGASAGIVAWGRLRHRPWLEGLTISVAIAAPLTLVVIGATLAFFGGSAPQPATVLRFFGFVWMISAAITAITIATNRSALPAPDAEPPTEEPAPAPPPAPIAVRPRLSDRLPPHLRSAAIHALQAEDHYLRVHTDAGSELILMRLGDAVPELEGVEGARTHRSWWVARAAIREVTRLDGRAELTLPGGVVAPVSRSAYPALRDAGWFAAAGG